MKIAIIGGGIAGLTCAARLGQLGIKDATVFDTGKHAVGGRCSSRIENVNGQLAVFDHSVQYFTATDSRFKKIVNYLLRDGAAKLWKGPVGKLQNGAFQLDDQLSSAFIGTDGMRSVAQSLAKFCNVQRPGWVGHISFDIHTKKWTVDKWGQYDIVVIAHNGKCAARLTEQCATPEIHRLCQTRFSPQANPKDNRMTLCSLFVLMVAFKQSLRLPFQGAHVQDSENLSWICNNTAKLEQKSSPTNIECWTLISSKSLAEQNKVPQEHIPPKVNDRIINPEAIGLKGNLPEVCFKRLQLWGAAVPVNTLKSQSECVFDARHQIGICSDWLVSPCVQGAAISGLAMAESIGKFIQGDTSSTSLQPRFKIEELSSPLGDFPLG